MTKFGFSGEGLINRFDLRDFDYFDYLQKGLIQPYDSLTGRMIIDPDTDHGEKIMESFENRPKWTIDQKVKDRLNKQIHEIGRVRPEPIIRERMRILYNSSLIQLNDCVRKSFKLSCVEKEAKKQIREAKKWLFKTDDVLSFERKHELERAEKHTPSDLPDPAGENMFMFFEGEWHIKYKGGESIKIKKDLKGIRYIVFLIANQGKEFDPLSLESLFDGLPCESNEKEIDTIEALEKMDDEQLEKEEGLSMTELPIEDLTIKEKDKIEDMVLDAWERSKSGKAEDVVSFEKCKRHVEIEHGIFVIKTNRDDLKFKFKKRLKPDADRVRKKISKNIKTAINRIKAKDKDLAEFLSSWISTGNLFHYSPTEIINWNIIK